MAMAYRRYRRKSYNWFGTAPIFVFLIVSAIVVVSPFTGIDSTNLLIVGIVLASFTIIVGICALWYVLARERRRLKALTIADIDNMAGVTFERYLGKLLQFKGFKVEFTALSHDFGVDIVARKGPYRYAIQAKRYTSSVGRAGVSDAVAGMRHYRCNKTMAITNSYFTTSARQLAESNDCELIDRDTLSNWILDFQDKKEPRIMKPYETTN